MAIILRLDRVMADRKMSLKELSEKVGIANVNLSKLKTGKVNAIRFSTLEAICDVLDCQPGDILEYQREEEQYKRDYLTRIMKVGAMGYHFFKIKNHILLRLLFIRDFYNYVK